MEKPQTAVSNPSTPSVISADIDQIPGYLQRAYWWAYLHPKAVHIFERQWLVNLILWGNFNRLRDAALQSLGDVVQGKTLQMACVYGNFTPHLADRLGEQASLDIIDVAPAQLENTLKKIGDHPRVRLHQQDASALQFENGEFDDTIVFFLLHEQPEAVRKKTIAEAIRVTKHGGQIVFVDYHRPAPWNPMRYVMKTVFRLLEPFAENFWRQDIETWSELDKLRANVKKTLFFGGLYQLTCIRLNPMVQNLGMKAAQTA